MRIAKLPTSLATAGLLAAALALPAPARAHADHAPWQVAQAAAQEGVQVGPKSRALSFASAEEVEQMSKQQYAQMLQQAAQQRALAPADHPQLQRLRRIAERIIPHAARFNERAPQWKWEVNLIGSKQINAFCMPGGKIAFYTGLLDQLQLTDDEVAMVMGHEIAHALREHGRERMGKAKIASGLQLGASVLSQVMGYGNLGGQLASGASQLTMLKYGRDDEKEADLVGLDIAARAGYDPRAGITLWRKMQGSAKGAPPEWLSTHPSGEARIKEIESHLPQVMPLYERARGRG